MSQIKVQFLVLALAVLSTACGSVCAQDAKEGASEPAIKAAEPSEPKKKKKSSSSEDESDYDAKPTRVLEGGVKGTALRLEEGLARIGLASELIEESTMKIMKESTRKDTIVVRGPNAIGNGIVLPAMGGVGGVMQFGEMPIRRDRLARFVSETEQNIAALQSYVDALIIPAEKTEAATAYGALRTSMETAQQQLTRLKELSAPKRLVNLKIGRAAMAINNAMADIDKQRQVLLKTSE